jgi:hypothetical protein
MPTDLEDLKPPSHDLVIFVASHRQHVNLQFADDK